MKRMFIKESTLRKVIRKLLVREATSTASVTRVAKPNPKGKAPASKKTRDAKHHWDVSKTKYQQSLSGYMDAEKAHADAHSRYVSHTGTEPSEQIPDDKKWTHPFTSQTTELGPGDTQPAKGWTYRQATDTTVSDTTKWIHPYSSVTTTLGQGETQPAKGWSYRQATTTPGKTDTTKWYNPYDPAKTTTSVTKLRAQPKFGWSRTQQLTAPSIKKGTQWIHPGSGEKWTTSLIQPADPLKGISGAKLPDTTWGVITRDEKTGAESTEWASGTSLAYKQAQKSIKPNQMVTMAQAPITRDSKQYGKLGYTSYEAGTLKDRLKSIDRATQRAIRTGFTLPKQTEKQYTVVQPTVNPKGPDVTSYATQYGQGGDAQYDLAKTVAGRDQWTDPKATTNPTTTQTSYATQYGQGSTDDYATAQAQSGRDQWAVADTTNPDRDNPAWATWSDEKQNLAVTLDTAVTKKADAKSERDTDLTKSQEAEERFAKASAEDEESFGKRATIDVPKSVAKGGSTTSKGGWGSGKVSSRGKGRGRGRGAKGKGRGKGRGRAKGSKGKKGKKSKKDESLMMRNNIISETIKPRRSTVKEIKQWMKTLEENRYKKIPHADARRVAWFVNNNLAEDYEQMPKSIVKKWSKAAYGRERYLAKEFIKSKKSEKKLRESIRGIIKKQLNEDYKNSKWEVYVGDDAYGKNRKVVKVAKSKRAATILYNKLIKTDKYFEVGMRAVK